MPRTSFAIASLLVSIVAPTAVAQTTAPVDIRPTLEQIFLQPRLLGTRPTGASISANGEWVLYRRAISDAEKAETEVFVVHRHDGSPRRLFDAKQKVQTFWSRRGADLLVLRDGWLEMHRIGPEPSRPLPLFEVGDRLGSTHFCEDGHRLVFTARSNNELFVLDLDDGTRRAPASTLTDRGSWFQVLGDERRAALFAAPSPPKAETSPGKSSEGGKPNAKTPADEAGDKGKANDTAPKKRVLWIVALDGSEPPLETKFEEGDDVTVSPSGAFALRQKRDNSEPRRLVMADYLTEQVTTVQVRSSLPGDPGFGVVFDLFDLAAGTAISLPLDAAARFWGYDVSFARTSDSVLIDRISDDWKVRQIFVADPKSKLATLVHTERDDAWIGGPEQYAALSEDATNVFFTSEMDGWNRLYRVHADGRELHCLSDSTSSGEISNVARVPRSDRFLVTRNTVDRANYELALIDGGNGESRVISRQDGVVTGVAIASGGSAVVYSQQFLGVPAELHAASLGAAEPPRELTSTQPLEFHAMKLPVPEIVEYASGDGTQVRAFLYKPPGFDPQKRYPAVVFIHGAGYLQQVLRSMTSYEPNYLFHQRLARKGYVVLDPDYRHSQGYGRKFRTDIYGFMGGKDLDDVVAGVDFLKRECAVDGSRVGIYGGSYGGFMTLMALFTKPDVFAAGCALRSVTDWRTYNAWYTNPRLGDPKTDAENFRRSSPIDHAEGLSKPLLLLHGLKDSNVFAQDTIRLMEKLIELRKDFDVMLYPSQDHGFTDPDSWLDEYRRIERFFDRHLVESNSNGTSARR